MFRMKFQGKHFRVTHTFEDDPTFVVSLNNYDDCLIITVLLKGSGSCAVEGVCHSFAPGTAVLVAADENVYYRFSEGDCHERMSFYFKEKFLADMPAYGQEEFREFIRKPSAFGSCYTPQEYDSRIVEPLLLEVREILQSSRKEQEGRLGQLLAELLMVFYKARNYAHQPDAALQDEDAIAVCKYIDEHLSEDLSYKRLQQELFFSRYHLGTKFQRQTGRTLTEYVIIKRLMRTCILARAGTGIEDAAYQCGFNTYSHFYKEFVKHFGISPKAYLGKKHPSA